jgi:glycosyltransferase involved in cell wall biosynthesis
MGKIWATLTGALQAVAARFRHGCDTLYYVPAPGKRGSLYRDWLVMALCRPFFRRLVLHWHAVGLGDWLDTQATPPERWITHVLLGHADLALILAPELAADAEILAPHRVAVVHNGVPDPGSPAVRPTRPTGSPCEVLFIGLGSRSKGLFDTLEAVALANSRAPGGFRLTVAGGFAGAEEESEFRSRATVLGSNVVQHVGFADDARKHALFSTADIFCFPTTYPHEGEPLSIIEALAYDVPVVSTRWRAIPGMLPAEHVRLVRPNQPGELADALPALRDNRPPAGALRQHYLAHFTRERHLAALAAALQSLHH